MSWMDDARRARTERRQRLLDRRLASGTLSGTLANAAWAPAPPPVTAPAMPFGARSSGQQTVVVAASDASDVSKAKADFVCSGSDDQETINRAIGLMGDRKGRVVLTEGVFEITGSIDFAASFVGVGIWETWLNWSGDRLMIQAHSISDLSMSDEGATPGEYDAAIRLYDGAAHNLQMFGAGIGVGIELVGFSHLSASYISWFDRNVHAEGWSTHVEGCYIEDALSAGVEVNSGHATITGTMLDRVDTGALVVANSPTVVSGCVLYGYSTPFGQRAIQNNSRMTITGNTFIEHNPAIQMDGDGVISGNRFENARDYAIVAPAGSAIVIDGNMFHAGNSTDQAIHVTGSSGRGPAITNNRFRGTPPPIVIDYGVEETLVNGNTFVDVTGGYLDDDGVDTSTGAGNFVNGVWVT